MPGRELREVGLVEPDRRLAHPGGVDDDALDDLQVPATGRADADALQRAAHGRLLARREVPEACHLLPVEIRARKVLRQVAHGPEPEPPQSLGDLGPDAGKRLDGGVRIGPPTRSERAGVLAGEAGRGGGYGSPSQ